MLGPDWGCPFVHWPFRDWKGYYTKTQIYSSFKKEKHLSIKVHKQST
jgi:hypothetical protein